MDRSFRYSYIIVLSQIIYYCMSPRGKKYILIIIVILVFVVGFILLSGIWKSTGVACLHSNYNKVGTIIDRSYASGYKVLEEWKDYTEPEVKFFFNSEAQRFISSEINNLRGYKDLSYTIVDKFVSMGSGYYGNKECEPIRYEYDIKIKASISGKDLSAALFGRGYYRDEYKIEAVYNPDSRSWEKFDVQVEERRLVPVEDLGKVLNRVNKNYRFREIVEEGYKISKVFWSPEGFTKIRRDTVTLVYSKSVKGEENLTDYFIIEVDNLYDKVVFVKEERRPGL